MRKQKDYAKTKFSASVLKKALESFKAKSPASVKRTSYSISKENEEWTYEDFENFLAEYNEADGYSISDYSGGYLHIRGRNKHNTSSVTVELGTKPEIEEIFAILESGIEIVKSSVPSSKRKSFSNQKIPLENIERVVNLFLQGEAGKVNMHDEFAARAYETTNGDETRNHSNFDEFKRFFNNSTSYEIWLVSESKNSIGITGDEFGATARINHHDVKQIDALFYELERNIQTFTLKSVKLDIPKPSPRIFVGHGHDPSWKELKEHLQDKHKYIVKSYESDPTTGQVNDTRLNALISECNFACLVLTREDEQKDGSFRGRQNVVLELGRCQEKYGNERALILLEEGTQEPSNMAGIDQIRFTRGRIREAFGDVVAAIRREFG